MPASFDELHHSLSSVLTPFQTRSDLEVKPTVRLMACYHSSGHVVFVARIIATWDGKAAKKTVAIPPVEGVT